MNYLKLINKCLIELNYKCVNSFSELIKNEHKKIKNIINIINCEVCTSNKWDFLLKDETLILPKGNGDITNSVNGKIVDLIINNEKYNYEPDFEKFFTNSQKSYTYSVFNNKILLPQFNEDKTINIIYLTNRYAKDLDGNEKSEMVNSDDLTIIPEPFAEPLLVYGTCMRLKGNPQHIRFSYWLSMYKNALANLVAYSNSTVEDKPYVKLKRN